MQKKYPNAICYTSYNQAFQFQQLVNWGPPVKQEITRHICVAFVKGSIGKETNL